MLRAALGPPDVDAAARRLVALLGEAAPAAPPVAWRPLPAAPPPARAVAVDGSHAILADGRSVVAGAWRAAAVRVEGGRTSTTSRMAVEVVTEAQAREVLAEALAEAGAAAEGPAADVGPGAVLEARRALGELALARESLAGLDAGDVLLLDGPLAWRPPLAPRAPLQALLDEAAARGVAVVGVCKSTSLAVGPEPVLAHLRRRARREAPPAWCAPLPVQPPRALAEAWGARLDPAQRWLFRYDVAPPPGGDAPAALGALAHLASTATYPGYPYPLALAHNAATLPESEAQDLRAALRGRAERLGLDAEAWEAAFADYHDVLEAGA